MRSNNNFIIHFSNLSLSRINYNNVDIIRKIINNLQDLTMFLKNHEFRLRRDDLVSFLKIDFAMRLNENNNKFKSKFENLKKKKSNSSKKKKIRNNKNDNNNI